MTRNAAGTLARAPRSLFALLALTKIALHLPAITRYGYFRDELYYLALSRSLAWGYVDQPPLSIAVLAGIRGLFGSSLLAIRAIPVLLGAGMVILAARLAERLGGGRDAALLAGFSVLLAPIYIGIDRVYSMNAIELVLWPLAALLLQRSLERETLRDWIMLGVVLGLGLLNKISMLWFLGGAFVGIVLAPERRVLRSRGPWVAVGIAGLLFLPYVLWEVTHGWPTLEFMRRAAAEKMVRPSPLGFLAAQVAQMNPLALPVWGTGLVAALRSRVPGARVLAIQFLAIAALLLLSGTSKPEYLAPAYLPLFAAGGVALERFFFRRPALRWGRIALPAAILLVTLLTLPVALPVLDPDVYTRYARGLGLAPPRAERYETEGLPQGYADMFGWEEMAAEVARVYRALPPADRAQCIVIAQNYGEAGAIDRFGPAWGLPPVACGHNSYWYRGVGRWNGEVAIVIGGSVEGYRRAFEGFERAGTIACARCMPYERNLPVYVARRLKIPMEKYWGWERLFI